MTVEATKTPESFLAFKFLGQRQTEILPPRWVQRLLVRLLIFCCCQKRALLKPAGKRPCKAFPDPCRKKPQGEGFCCLTKPRSRRRGNNSKRERPGLSVRARSQGGMPGLFLSKQAEVPLLRIAQIFLLVFIILALLRSVKFFFSAAPAPQKTGLSLSENSIVQKREKLSFSEKNFFPPIPGLAIPYGSSI